MNLNDLISKTQKEGGEGSDSNPLTPSSSQSSSDPAGDKPTFTKSLTQNQVKMMKRRMTVSLNEAVNTETSRMKNSLKST